MSATVTTAPELLAREARTSPAMPARPEALTEYTAAHRSLEISAIVVFGALVSYLFWRLASATSISQLWIIGAAAVTGYVAADFISGIVHWLFDTWGSVDTPLLGRSFIRPFREHHADAMSITRHDFIETNGNNCLASLPVLAGACFLPAATDAGIFALAFLLFTSLGVLATNQFHKWAHVEHPGSIVRQLQRWHLILPSEHHRVHHAAPYATHYCITTGWLNPLLRAADFHRRMERLVTAVTGVEPRRDEP